MWFSKKSSSFASRVDKFWCELGKNLDVIKRNLEDKNYETASKMTEEALNLCLVDPTFMIGLIDGKIDLVLTPEGLKHRLLWLKFIKSRMPKEYEAKLTCTLGKPRAPRNVATIQMYGVSVDANEVMVYANFNDKSVDMCLYNETLSKLKSEDENKAYTLSLILCDNVVGEMIMINMLGEFDIIDEPREKGVPLIDFADLIDDKFGKDNVPDNIANSYRKDEIDKPIWRYADGITKGDVLKSDQKDENNNTIKITGNPTAYALCIEARFMADKFVKKPNAKPNKKPKQLENNVKRFITTPTDEKGEAIGDPYIFYNSN